MKLGLNSLVFIAALFLSLLFPTYAADTYMLDPAHSYVLWHIDHFGYSHPSGKWMAEGTLVLDEAKLQKSKIKVTLQIAELVTGIPKLDEHLKGNQFFDVEKFPLATFISKKIEPKGKKAKVHGVLTLHGVAVPVTLDVVLNKLAVNPMTQKMTAGFTAKTKLKRSDFGLKSYLPGLGDEVKIDIEVEATKTI